MPSLGLIALLLLTALPLLEIAVLIKVGSVIGVTATLAIIVITFFIGISVVRHQGLGVARRFMTVAQSGQPPLEPMVEAMLLMMAGACLILPGLITDAIGLALLIPWLRQWVARGIVTRWSTSRPRARMSWRVLRDRRAPGHPRGRSPSAPPIIDGDFKRVDDPPAPSSPKKN